MSPERRIIGWDLGGAHLKLAMLDKQGQLCNVAQRATPIWEGLEHLADALDAFASEFPLADCEHYLTMTGELVDLFEDRQQGVAELVAFVAEHLPHGHLRIYAGPEGFLEPCQAGQAHARVGSANWYATAAWLARNRPGGLMVDVGSTTTDLLPFCGGEVHNRGYSDRERLACEELIYTGVVRTPLMAVVDKVPFAGEWLHLANEHFATTADVYRILERLPADADLHPSADGRDKSRVCSMRRLARMIGADFHDGSEQQWSELAGFIADRQLDELSRSVQLHLSAGSTNEGPIVGAGVGSFVARALAERLGLGYLGIEALFGSRGDNQLPAAVCAPAVAVAGLAASQSADKDGALACAC